MLSISYFHICLLHFSLPLVCLFPPPRASPPPLTNAAPARRACQLRREGGIGRIWKARDLLPHGSLNLLFLVSYA